MRAKIFSARMSEKNLFLQEAEGKGIDLDFEEAPFSSETIEKAQGYDAIVIASITKIDQATMEKVGKAGVRYIVCKATGYSGIDVAAARKAGIRFSNIPSYSPSAISESTILLLLNILRKYKLTQHLVEKQDFRITSLLGRELRDMTVGIVGTGSIGRMTAETIEGFGAKVLAYNRHKKSYLKPSVEQVSLEELYSRSDAIIFHCPYTGENYHMVNRETLRTMRDQVILVNTARGELFDWESVLEGLNEGKIGGLGFDVFEDEAFMMRKNLEGQTIHHPTFTALLARENVVFTPHIAFYTDTAIENMAKYTVNNLYQYKTKGVCQYDILP